MMCLRSHWRAGRGPDRTGISIAARQNRCTPHVPTRTWATTTTRTNRARKVIAGLQKSSCRMWRFVCPSAAVSNTRGGGKVVPRRMGTPENGMGELVPKGNHQLGCSQRRNRGAARLHASHSVRACHQQQQQTPQLVAATDSS